MIGVLVAAGFLKRMFPLAGEVAEPVLRILLIETGPDWALGLCFVGGLILVSRMRAIAFRDGVMRRPILLVCHDGIS